jgi:hypothetical protein
MCGEPIEDGAPWQKHGCIGLSDGSVLVVIANMLDRQNAILAEIVKWTKQGV